MIKVRLTPHFFSGSPEPRLAKGKNKMAISTRLTICVDTKLVLKLQATLQLKLNRKITIAEVIRIAVNELAILEKVS